MDNDIQQQQAETVLRNRTILIGEVVTELWYSDRHVYDVVARTMKTLTLRERKAVLDEPPIIVPGGFCGVCVRNATWHTVSNPNGLQKRAYWSEKNGWWQTPNGKLIIGDFYHYDYNF